ncbi:hypothetical protein PIB30_044712 [Stylosanthes scabra]|uniref:AAA+ ATPase domain-containing protein n=1 Tax=Stylosanthes scabra TaxID=79078 RepID=A0ABU6UJ73_9FABA|nr:hypothetical protein [Stylosanthes scabra]
MVPATITGLEGHRGTKYFSSTRQIRSSKCKRAIKHKDHDSWQIDATISDDVASSLDQNREEASKFKGMLGKHLRLLDTTPSGSWVWVCWRTDPVVQFATKILKEELNYLLSYEKNIKDVDNQFNKLKQERQKWGDRVAEEEDRHGREIYPDVSKWLADAGKIIERYEKFQKEEEDAHAGCSAGFPPNLLARHFRSRKSIQLKEDAENHLKRATFNVISHGGGPPSLDLLSNVDYQSLTSRDKAMERITNALKDSSARMIGVHGPSGVGKTTLVMKAVKDLQEGEERPKLFDVVIVANVTKTPNIRKIQGQIADMLWMKLEEENGNQKNEKGEKSRNSTNLEEEKPEQQAPGRDAMKAQQAPEVEVTEQLDASPSSSSSSSASDSSPIITLTTEEHYKGCKVLLISEASQLLNQMDVRPDLVVPVSLLDEKEAMILFNKMAGIGDKSSEFGDLPAQIAKKCNGLSMSIVTTAKGLKNQNRLVWEDTRQKLETQTWGGTPEHSTQLVYGLLENEELKITFLLCACMDNDALVSDLVRLCVGLGFLPGISTVKATRTRVQVMLMKLKESGLLSNSYSSDRFTMQNLVRTTALSIASKERHMLMLNKGKIDEWPDEDELKRYVAISLRHCHVTDAITKSLTCDKLKILEINNDDPHLKLPRQFFKQMKELKVLNLTGVQLSPLGSSIGSLTKLRMLCLEQCTLIPSSVKSSLSKELRVIKKLKNLRILSFSGSNIDCLPLELGDLSNLQTLDISNCLKLNVIPPNVISRLTSLEELYMRNTPIQWQPSVNGVENGQREKASLSELRDLNQLTNLDIQIKSVDHLPKNLFFDKLSSYKIVIGSSNSYLERNFKMPEKHELSMFLAIHQKGGIRIHAQKAIKMLFERVEYLLLGKLTGVQDLFYELNLKGFPRLKYLAIQNNHEIKFLIHPPDMQQPLDKAFEKLETLLLYKVTKIEKICFSPSCLLSKPSFENLKTIKINLCEELKYLFSSSMLELLTSLETIQASDCDSLEKIVHVESTDASKTLMLPKMRTLKLQSLPEFSGFAAITLPPEGIVPKILFHEKVEVSKLERLELSWIQINQIWSDKSSDFGNLIHLDVSGCHNLIYLLPYSLATNLKKLQSLYVSECYNMKNIFIPLPDGSEKVAKGVCFPNLKNIKLSRMSSLGNIWSHDVSVEKLDTLVIEKCNELVNVFRPDMEGIFQGLSSLTVTNCKSMETIFDLTADDKKRYAFETVLRDVHLESLPKLKKILRCQGGHEGTLQLKSLQNITVQHCNELASIFPFSIIRERQLGKLQFLLVSDCSE